MPACPRSPPFSFLRESPHHEPALLWGGTGDHHFEVTTDVPLAQASIKASG